MCVSNSHWTTHLSYVHIIDIEVLQIVVQQGLSVVHDHMDIAFVVFSSIHVGLFFLSLQTKSTRSGLAEGGE